VSGVVLRLPRPPYLRKDCMEIFLENGEHNGNLWLTDPPFPEPETGRYSLTCDTCLRIVQHFNWKYTSPGMFSENGTTYRCDDCTLVLQQRMPYAEYLKTNHWQWVREEALNRAKWKCQLCARKTRLQVHHNYARVGRELPEDVIVLCSGCHKKHHKTT
jgi:hypothetical protein